MMVNSWPCFSKFQLDSNLRPQGCTRPLQRLKTHTRLLAAFKNDDKTNQSRALGQLNSVTTSSTGAKSQSEKKRAHARTPALPCELWLNTVAHTSCSSYVVNVHFNFTWAIFGSLNFSHGLCQLLDRTETFNTACSSSI